MSDNKLMWADEFFIFKKLNQDFRADEHNK
jgi:hypothetical protein